MVVVVVVVVVVAVVVVVVPATTTLVVVVVVVVVANPRTICVCQWTMRGLAVLAYAGHEGRRRRY